MIFGHKNNISINFNLLQLKVIVCVKAETLGCNMEMSIKFQCSVSICKIYVCTYINRYKRSVCLMRVWLWHSMPLAATHLKF